jgi:hypothetical protein
MTSFLCPVCGFDLGFEPWSGDSASDEICPSCGIQFGYDDARPELRDHVYEARRKEWIASGMPWASTQPSPQAWSPQKQLKSLILRGLPTALHKLADRVDDEHSFLEFVKALREDLAKRPNEWHNETLGQFLESAEAWAHDSSFGARVGIPASASAWRKLASFLYAGKIYE